MNLHSILLSRSHCYLCYRQNSLLRSNAPPPGRLSWAPNATVVPWKGAHVDLWESDWQQSRPKTARTSKALGKMRKMAGRRTGQMEGRPHRTSPHRGNQTLAVEMGSYGRGSDEDVMTNGRRLHFSPASYAFLYLLRVPADWPAGGDGVGSRSVGSNASPSRPAQVGLSRTSSGGATINTQLAEGEETEPTTRRWCEGIDKRRQQYPPLKSDLWGSVGWRRAAAAPQRVTRAQLWAHHW